eukprot:CAMPEP_0197454022 /NCGR_PEP_ID=MMETSP1175-20131217/36754_1 /TAXON_ID=1003142 /ORGANISM="Triceratium dubium, Strain CCMP147" /LENGTH=100 /DNA_ID=CAMNT_0042987483 /DNA_START=9 /DNA_END=311 /DNA_ORIENTATION=-
MTPDEEMGGAGRYEKGGSGYEANMWIDAAERVEVLSHMSIERGWPSRGLYASANGASTGHKEEGSDLSEFGRPQCIFNVEFVIHAASPAMPDRFRDRERR